MRLSIQKYWHDLFEIGVFIKGFNGVWETLSGLTLLFVSHVTLSNWFYFLASNELVEDPRDKIFGFIAHALETPHLKTLAALYILGHGLLNLFLAIQLWRDRHWAYLVMVGTTLLFMIYQVYRIYIHHSTLLTIITIFDALFIILAWHEYRYHRDKKALV